MLLTFGTRPRNVCQTCRLRRVKCDGTRPSCTRCTSSNRLCLGYEVVTAEPKEHRDFPFGNQAVTNTIPRLLPMQGAQYRAREALDSCPGTEFLEEFPGFSLSRHSVLSDLASLMLEPVFLTAFKSISASFQLRKPCYPTVEQALKTQYDYLVGLTELRKIISEPYRWKSDCTQTQAVCGSSALFALYEVQNPSRRMPNHI